MRRLDRFVCVAIAGIAAAVTVRAQGSEPSFGLQSGTAYVVSAWEMQPATSASQWLQAANGHRYVSGGAGLMVAGLRLPSGALIESLGLEACDSSDPGSVTFTLVRFDAYGSPGVQLATVETGAADSFGCDNWFVQLAAPETVDNGQYRYLIEGGNDTPDGSTTFGAVRIYYRLQVSPAGFPSFNDVPASDPAFQFIEALVSSGITAGCGNGNFCPDAPLTRRQMAVFLTKALGLHWTDLVEPN